jgi:hypothetical protein
MLDHLAPTGRLHDNCAIELRTVGASLSGWWEPHSEAVANKKVNDGAIPEVPVHL